MRLSGRFPVAVLCLLAAGCGRSVSYYLDTGAKQYEAGKYDDAVINYRKAIQKSSNSGEAYYGLGRSLLKQQKAGEAFGVLKKAVELAPDNMDGKLLLANVALSGYLADSRRPKVLYDLLGSLAAQFLTKDPNSFDGLRLKGHLALSDRNLAGAAAYFRHANQVKPMQPEVVLMLAQVLFRDEKTAYEGEQLIVELIAKHPESGQAYDVLYSRYSAANRPADAEKILQAKVAANPRQAPYVEQLAEHYRRAGKPEQMAATLALMLDNPKDFPQARLQVGDYYNMTGAREKALANYEEGARAEGAGKLVYGQRMVGTMAALGRTDQALALAEQTLKDQPRDPDLRTLHAVLLVQTRKFDSAVQELHGLIAEKKDDPALHFQLGRALLLKGDVTAGRTELREAARLGKRYMEPRLALASMAVDTGQFQEALTEVDEVLAIAPDNPGALVLRAAALQGLGRFQEARSLLTALQTRFPNAAGLDVEIGFLNLHEKKFVEAEKVFRKRYQPGQENLRALVGLMQTLAVQKRGAEAVRILEAELARVPDRPQVQLMLADGYHAGGDSVKAMQVLEQLTATHPDLALAHLRLGDLQIRKGELDRAIATLTKARDLAPKNIEPLLLLGGAQLQSQHSEEAMQNYRAVLKLDAGNLEALNNLAFLTADTGGSLEEALKLATEASQKAPKQPNIADTMGFVRQYPSNPTFRYHHGLALLETGDKAGAKAELQAALADKPADALAAKIKDALGRTG